MAAPRLLPLADIAATARVLLERNGGVRPLLLLLLGGALPPLLPPLLLGALE